MIAADARTRFTAGDLELIEAALVSTAALTPERAARVLDRLGPDDLLDDEAITTFLLESPVPGPSPSLFFYTLVRQALRAQGIQERRIADYCAALLREFGIRRRANRISTVDDQEHEAMVDLIGDLAHASGTRRFRAMVHLGEYALWLAGLFPDRIEAQQNRRGGPDLSYYEALGHRGYSAASDHRLASESGLADIYRLAAERFTPLRESLTSVRSRLTLRAA